MIDLKGKRILVTGGHGFLGGHLVEHLIRGYDAEVVARFHRDEYDLTSWSETAAIFSWVEPDYVFHLAGHNGGIQFNLDHPAEIFMQNTLMGMNVLKACAKFNVKKVVSVVASCGSDHSKELLEPCDFLAGSPHDTVACHGYAKRNLQLASKWLTKQHGIPAVCAMPTTLYGPGDCFDPKRAKVMGAMVKRFCDAVRNHEQEVVVWGTGRPMRDFLYVEDAAKLLAQVMTHYPVPDKPIHLSFGQELSIASLTAFVAEATGFNGRIVFDDTKPDGQHRKRLMSDATWRWIPGIEATPLLEGIKKTVAWYRKHTA